MSYTADQLATGTLVFLLELVIDGRVYRFGSEFAEVVNGDEVLVFREGLEVGAFADRVTAPGEGVENPSQQMTVWFTDDTATGWGGIAKGLAATGTLSLWLPGTAYSTRRELLSGDIEATTYGALYEPVALVLNVAPWESNGAQVPGDTALVNPSTWPRSSSSGVQVGDGVEGLYYPVPIGAPGYARPRDPSGSYAAVPALLVEIDSSITPPDNTVKDAVLVIGQGRLECVDISNSVLIRNRTEGRKGSAALTPSQATDELGQTVTIVTVSHATLPIVDGDELWCSFELPGASGIPSGRGGVLREAGDVITYLLGLSGAAFDGLGLSGVRTWLKSYMVDTHFNDPVDPIDVVLDDLLPLFPVSLKATARGLSLVPWRYDATAADAVAHIDADESSGIERVSDVQRSPVSSIVNHMTIRYAPHGAEDTYLGRVVFLPTKRYSDTERERHPYSVVSASRYGKREAAPIDTDMVVNTATAQAILSWKLRWGSQPHERLTVQGPQMLQTLEPGEVVTVTDAEVGWDSRVCIVETVYRDAGVTGVDVVTVPDWVAL